MRKRRSWMPLLGVAILGCGMLSAAGAAGAVVPASPCVGTNATDVAIPDGTTGTVSSAVTISGCTGNAAAASAVEVHINHTAIGDLVVNLVAPDGTWYLLHNRKGGLADNINKAFSVNLSSEVANGTWRLRAQDALTGQVGFIDSWTLELAPGNIYMMAWPAASSVSPGASISTSVSTAQLIGAAQTTSLSASGLPAGATAAFTPSTVTPSSTASTLTISTTNATPPGVYPVTITGTDINRSVTYTLTVLGCRGTNNTDVAVPDLGAAVVSAITVSNCPGNAVGASIVEVHVAHANSGDLMLDLIAPDGSVYPLYNRNNDGVANVHRSFTTNLTSEAANGTWRLRAQDLQSADAGLIDNWSLDLVGGGSGPGPCLGVNGADTAIPDNAATVDSAITIAGCAGNGQAASTVEVHLVHTYINDLIVNLIAPDGTVYGLHNRNDGEDRNIDQRYTVNLTGEASNGTWKLRVQDTVTGDTGFINTWTLNLVGTPGACIGANAMDVSIPDTAATAESAITITGCAGTAEGSSTVEVHITHPYIDDLTVDLIAPDGSVYTLFNRGGGGTAHLDKIFTVNLAGEAASGTWRLRAKDMESADAGFINSWNLRLRG